MSQFKCANAREFLIFELDTLNYWNARRNILAFLYFFFCTEQQGKNRWNERLGNKQMKNAVVFLCSCFLRYSYARVLQVAFSCKISLIEFHKRRTVDDKDTTLNVYHDHQYHIATTRERERKNSSLTRLNCAHSFCQWFCTFEHLNRLHRVAKACERRC